jgi:hypothetical protein
MCLRQKKGFPPSPHPNSSLLLVSHDPGIILTSNQRESPVNHIQKHKYDSCFPMVYLPCFIFFRVLRVVIVRLV